MLFNLPKSKMSIKLSIFLCFPFHFAFSILQNLLFLFIAYTAPSRTSFSITSSVTFSFSFPFFIFILLRIPYVMLLCECFEHLKCHDVVSNDWKYSLVKHVCTYKTISLLLILFSHHGKLENALREKHTKNFFTWLSEWMNEWRKKE